MGFTLNLFPVISKINRLIGAKLNASFKTKSTNVDLKEFYYSDPCSDFILITNDETTLILGLSPGNDNVGTKGWELCAKNISILIQKVPLGSDVAFRTLLSGHSLQFVKGSDWLCPGLVFKPLSRNVAGDTKSAKLLSFYTELKVIE